MAAAAGPATPQRPLPGAFTATPANPGQGATIFAAQAASLRQNIQPQTTGSPGATTSSRDTTGVEDAAKTINNALQYDASFPAMEDYIQQGVSGKYELPSAPAWLPFQKLKMHDLPPKLLHQANLSGMGMMMGVFPSLSHAWVALDNCLYLWDYTLPNPEIIGFEENTQPIAAVKLVPPKPGVFIEDIKHMIVICTANDMLLLGVAAQATSTGAQTIALYNTRMSIQVKGLGVKHIIASKRTGRIFFTGSLSDDIYEFQYQQDEGWFRGRCNRICHTKGSMNFVSENIQAVGHYFGPQPKAKALKQLVIDDSRNMLYSLSTSSEIRVWLIKDRLEPSLSRPMGSLLQNTGHFSSRTELLTGRDVELASISAIPLAEAGKVSLMATTTTGCRLYMSLTRGYGFPADSQNPPSSMQILHIRFPPRDPNAPVPTQQPLQNTLSTYTQPLNDPAVDNTSTYLKPTKAASRFSPGYFMAFQPNQTSNVPKDNVFVAAPDSARLSNRAESQPGTNFTEYGQWIELPSEMQEVVSMSADFGATGQPQGFGNELAVQYDMASPEFAIVTTTGVQTIRRRRLVDIFASMMKYGSSNPDGLDGDIKHFVRTYGRAETAATSLAVACGQGVDVAENRVATVTDPEVLEKARRAFIEHGGKPEWSINNEEFPNGGPVDNTKPSPRYEGTALYVTRIVRSIWKATIMKDIAKPGTGAKLAPTIGLDKLRSIQRDLTSLKDFLDRNRSFIEGLAGPQALSKATTRQEEMAIQGEHQKMHALLQLVNSISEGISFVLVLFDETIEDVLALLHEDSRTRAKQLTFEGLFVSTAGRDLAKELVKAIVNRNIANGSNVDTVAEALRRRCGSFCSADDVVIFKASEQIRRAEDNQGKTEGARMLLNESSKLFQRVAGSLTYENVKAAVESYYRMAFYAGAIQLCLCVANEKDKSKRALAWTKDGRPNNDAREAAFQERKQYYELIFATLRQLDLDTASMPEIEDGKYTLAMRRRNEAYDIVNNSDDIAFLATLYDWYYDLQQPDRLLEIDNPYVVEYLKKMSEISRPHADLLWRYYAHHNDYLQAASMQVQIAQSHFEGVTLEERIGYLSRARTNASTRQTVLTDNRQSKQKLLREVSDLLDIAAVQDELLQRIHEENRLTEDKRRELIAKLGYAILDVTTLFTDFADAAGYHDICILLYQVADHRNPADVMASWQQLINQTHQDSYANHGKARRPWEAVGEKVRMLGRRLHTAAGIFPIQFLLPMLERYIIQPQDEHPPSSWAIDIMLDLEVPHETLLPVLEQLYYSNEHPFVGSKRKIIAGKMVYLLQKWFEASVRSGERIIFGSEENASTVQDCLATLLRGDLDASWRQQAETLTARIAQAMR